jgi:hypothetical protein
VRGFLVRDAVARAPNGSAAASDIASRSVGCGGAPFARLDLAIEGAPLLGVEWRKKGGFLPCSRTATRSLLLGVCAAFVRVRRGGFRRRVVGPFDRDNDMLERGWAIERLPRMT